MLSRRVNNFDMSYVAAGAGEPVVLIHGSFSDWRYWSYQMEAFAAKFAIFAPSMRPYWPNPIPTLEGEFSVPQYVRDAGAFIEALDVGKVHLCGHSLGGHIALRVAKDFPHVVRSLVLAEPGGPLAAGVLPASPAASAAAAAPDLIGTAAAKVRTGDVEAAFEFMFSNSGGGGWQSLPEFYQEMARANAGTLIAQAVEQRPPIGVEDIRAITCPVLLIGGERTPQPFPRILDALESCLSDVRRVTIERGTHLMNIDNPEAFNAAVLAFWTRSSAAAEGITDD